MKYVVVLPYVYQPYLDSCVLTMAPEFKDNVLFIDNTVDNIGIMASHNKGIDLMREKNADWLIILSAAVRFGSAGGLDFIEQLEKHMDHYVIHAASDNVVGGKQHVEGGGGKNAVYGWHLTAFRNYVFDDIGRWDENFTPYGFDDIDLSLRIKKHYKGAKGWDTYPCDVSDTRMSHSINLAHVQAPSAPRMLYFCEKWGRHPGAYQWDGWEHPFNEEKNSLKFWPPAPNEGKWDD